MHQLLALKVLSTSCYTHRCRMICSRNWTVYLLILWCYYGAWERGTTLNQDLGFTLKHCLKNSIWVSHSNLQVTSNLFKLVLVALALDLIRPLKNLQKDYGYRWWRERCWDAIISIAAADVIGESNDEHGVAKAIYQYAF